MRAWQGTLMARGGSHPVTGSIAAVARERTTDVSIRIEGAPAVTPYAWLLRSGSCEQAGERVGGAASYPALETNDSGNATATTVLSQSMQPGRAYHAAVLHGSDPQTVVACGEMEEWSGA